MRLVKIAQILVMGVILSTLLPGCVTPEKIIATFPEIVESVSSIIKPSVVYVKVTNTQRGYLELNGLIISQDGQILIPLYIKRDELEKVQVWVDKDEYDALLVQSDERYSISILKIEPKTSLKPAIIGDGKAVKEGEWLIGVCSLGKEYDYQKVIDIGIVSGRLEGAIYDEFLLRVSDVKAGMPFVNLKGEVVGFGPSFQMRGGPNRVVLINQIKEKKDKLIAKAKEGKEKTLSEKIDAEKKKPWLGIIHGLLNEEYAEAKNFSKESILVKHVFSNSPAAEGGLEPGDLIIEVDGQAITKSGERAIQQFDRLQESELNREITFKVLRENKTRLIKCKFGPKPEPKEFKAEDLGITVKEITDIEYYEGNLAVKEGILVTGVERGSAAATSDVFGRPLITNNDVIVEFYRIPTRTFDEFIKAVDTMRREKPEVVSVKLWRGNRITHVALNLKIGKREKEK